MRLMVTPPPTPMGAVDEGRVDEIRRRLDRYLSRWGADIASEMRTRQRLARMLGKALNAPRSTTP